MASSKSDFLSSYATKSCVFLDSNFILVPLALGIDILQEIPKLVSGSVDLILLDAVKKELEELAHTSGPKLQRQIESSLRTIGPRCREVHVVSSAGETVDDLLVRVAIEKECPVATNDKALKRKLRHQGIPVIFVRQNSRLELEGWVDERSNSSPR